MNTCDTCKHWTDFDAEVRAGICGHKHTTECEVVHFYRLDGVVYEDWEKVPVEGRERADLFKTIVRATSPSSAFVDAPHSDFENLVTGPKFGCIHHEPQS
jgi:hypothetical protein